MAGRQRPRVAASAGALLLGLAPMSCELTTVDLTQPEDVLIAEVYVEVVEDLKLLTAVLHGTTGTASARHRRTSGGGHGDGFVRKAAPHSSSPRGRWPSAVRPEETPPGVPACYRLSTTDPALAPGVELDLEIRVDDGRELVAAATIPLDFGLRHPVPVGTGQTCVVEPDSTLEIMWSVSPGAWAYLSEATISGLSGRVPPEIEVPDQSLELIGLSISAADTTVTLPSEFGIFDRFGDFADLLELLQNGLPEGTGAQVSVAAVDRNYVNWARGGNFNPSGQVRVASIRGDGTGVFGTLLSRSVIVEAGGGPPTCTRP